MSVLSEPQSYTESAAYAFVEAHVWANGRVCPHCGAFNQSGSLKGKSTRPGVYNCKDCRQPFSVTVGTVIERSHISLSKWVLASRLLASSKKSMSAHQLEADSSVPKSSDPPISS